jgi:tRNA 2-thiouridine synthesizing protein A
MLEMTEITQELDLKGLNCPLPILRIKQTLTRMDSGEIVRVVGTEPGTEREVNVLCQQGGHELLEFKETNKEFIYIIRKN